MKRGELVALLGPKLHTLTWQRPAAAPPDVDAPAIAEVASGVLIRGPGDQQELILTTPEWRLLHDAIRAGEYAGTVDRGGRPS